MKRSLYEVEKNYKDTFKAKAGIENECRNLEQTDQREMDQYYQGKMTLDKNQQFGALQQHRHERDSTLAKGADTEQTEFL